VDKAVFLGVNALGDTLCTTPVIRAFRRANPGTAIVYLTQAAPFTRVLDGNPDIDLLLYSERLYFNGIPDATAAWLTLLPLDLRAGKNLLYRLDLKIACTTMEAFQEHISKSFARPFNLQTDTTRPIVVLSDLERRAASLFARRPFIVFSSHSVSNPDRPDGRGKRKDWPHERWQELALRIRELGEFDIYQVGSERDEAPALEGVTRLYGLPIKVVAALLERADCVVTVENGIGHLCHAVDAASVVIYSNLMPLAWANPAESTLARVLYGDPHDLTCDAVLAAIQQVLAASRLDGQGSLRMSQALIRQDGRPAERGKADSHSSEAAYDFSR
jgi:ADP-heptose:LPS heptosyltransferase